MRRLSNGVYALLADAPRSSSVQSIQHPRAFQVPADRRDELIRLAHGTPDSEEPSKTFFELQGVGMAEEYVPAEDPAIVERLAHLGRGFAWHVRGCPDAAGLVSLLQRLHSRRKLSLFEHGQTACLPEAGVARCWELTRRMGKNQKVLIIGDDDLLSLVLARMGHRVTVIDIDQVLIAFLARCARDEKIKIDARVQDVLAPLPDSLVDTFDVVLTDPMSFENCLQAFLSRARNAVKEGGAVFTCVHPRGRGVFQRVAGSLPVDVEDVLYELSTYYYQGFIENWYRSDLYMLRRKTGEPRFLPTDSIPFEDIIQGTLEERLHGFTDIKGYPFRKVAFSQVQSAVDGWSRMLGDDAVIHRHVRQDDAWGHMYLALKDGGHLALVFEAQRGAISYDLYPYHEVRDGMLVAHFSQHVPLARSIHFNASPADLALPSVVVPPAKPAKKKSARRT